MSNTIIRLCKQITTLTEADFAEMQSIIESQAGYVHPLKNATATRLHNLSDHNQKVLFHLRNTWKNIIDGEPVVKQKVQKI